VLEGEHQLFAAPGPGRERIARVHLRRVRFACESRVSALDRLVVGVKHDERGHFRNIDSDPRRPAERRLTRIDLKREVVVNRRCKSWKSTITSRLRWRETGIARKRKRSGEGSACRDACRDARDHEEEEDLNERSSRRRA
jgi:hypothetical protein